MEPIEEKNMPATEEATAELFDDIDAPYFIESGFDAMDYELQKMLGMEFEIDELERERFKLKRQLQVVSKKVSFLIMKNSLTFSTEVKHYSQIQSEANAIVQIIKGIRSTLNENNKNCTAAIGIVANDRNQKYLLFLKKILNTIKTLHETEYRLKELIQEGDFPTAIQICVEAINATKRYKHFTCVRQLSEKLARILESMESHLDDALASLTIVFDYDRYSLVHSAYRMLGKLEGASMKLQTFFRATIESSARSMVVGVLKLDDQLHLQPDSMSYEQLCEAIPLHELLRTIGDMAFVMSKVLSLYHSILRFHVKEDERLLCAAGPSSSYNAESDYDAPPLVEKGVFQKSLLDNLYPIFKCAANKFNTLLCCHDLAALKFDDFIKVVEISNRFRKFGRNHFGNCCTEVALTLEKQTNTYFARYHLERMDELKMFLENEIFALCPVSVQFTLFDLAEFHFLKESTDSFDDLDEKQARLRQMSAEQNANLGEQLDFILLTSEDELAFMTANSMVGEASSSANVALQSSLAEQNSLERSSSEESCYSKNGEEAILQNSMPNLCNTALNLLRYIGKYIRMTSILHSTADQAILGIIQLYKYFFFSIYSFFCSDSEPIPQSDLEFSSLRLRNSIEAIRRTMIVGSSAGSEALPNESVSFGETQPSTSQFGTCQPSPCILLNDNERLFALAERIVGVESMIFLSKQLELLRPVLESLMTRESRSRALDDFYKQILPVAIDLRVSSYGCVASRALNYTQIVKQVVSVNWEVQELQSQHSAYVDYIIREVKSFEHGLSQVCEFAHISQELKTTIWSCLLSCIFRTMVQGNSEASKNCSNEGRALMLLDFELLTRELEATTTIRPLPHKSYLENYIKAFYLPPEDLDEWIVHHTEYTVNQVTTLLNASSSNTTRSAKSRLITMLENKDLLS